MEHKLSEAPQAPYPRRMVHAIVDCEQTCPSIGRLIDHAQGSVAKQQQTAVAHCTQ